MENTTKELHTLRGELTLAAAVCINSLGVVLMLYSGAGISAISSVPFAFSEVLPRLTLGTWTYLFQGLLVLSLMFMRKRFVPPYLFSFVVGFVFGELLDFHEWWIGVLPTSLPMRVLYFRADLYRHCPVQPVRAADYSHRPVPAGIVGHYFCGIPEDQDRV